MKLYSLDISILFCLSRARQDVARTTAGVPRDADPGAAGAAQPRGGRGRLLRQGRPHRAPAARPALQGARVQQGLLQRVSRSR